jgi:hypothetical protein
MAQTRSPRYPNIPLGEAIIKAKAIYHKEHMSPLSPAVAAEAMGYSGINGSSLKTISALRKYGLLEGRGDDVRISKDAQTLVIDDMDSPDFRAAVRRCALNPELFSELRRQFPGQASERNIAVFLEKQGFKPDAAALTAKNFKDTMALVPVESEGYNSGEETEPEPAMQTAARPETARHPTAPPPGPPPEGDKPVFMLQGERLSIRANVDLDGLKKLRDMLEKFQGMMELNALQ